MHIDGASNKNGASVGVVLKYPEGTILELGVRLGFEASNNESEYETIILGLKRVKALGIENLRINCDSQLVANQLTGEYCARNQKMEAYMKLAQQLIKSFTSAYVERFPRTNNSHAYALATLASAVNSKMKRTIDVEYLPKPSIESELNQVMCINLGPSWMDPIIAYLKQGTLPTDSKEAHKVKI